MTLPPDFIFSQNNLQDFLDCPRRFELRFLKKLDWPAIQSEPVLEMERHLQRGARFHQMIHQHQLGLDAGQITLQTSDPDLALWWQNYLDYAPINTLPLTRLPELMLRSPFAGYRITAKFDLLAIAENRVVILDWKTNPRRPSRSFLSKRIQTRLYPFLIATSGASLNSGIPFSPDHIQMIYWFPSDPHNPEVFTYDNAQFESDQKYLTSIIRDIEQFSQTTFPLTEDDRTCKYCQFRSFCDRGVQAGEFSQEVDSLWEEADNPGLMLDFDQIPEIEY